MPDVTARIYLDNCALNRPWDDQSQIRIHREAESVLFVLPFPVINPTDWPLSHTTP